MKRGKEESKQGRKEGGEGGREGEKKVGILKNNM